MRLTEVDYYALARLLGGKPLDDDTQRRLSETGRALVQKLSVVDDLRERWEYAFYAKLLSRTELNRIGLIDPDGLPPTPRARVMPAAALAWLPRLEFLIDGEIPKRSLVVLYGASGVGKSFVAVDYAMRIAQTCTVCYAPTEGLHGYAKRLKAWSLHHKQPLPACLYFLQDNVNLLDQATVTDTLNELAALQPRLELLIIDTLAMSMIGADENSARDMGIALSACRRIIESLECSVMLVHHSGKESLWERGSSALRGNSDVMIRVSSIDDVLQLECTKAKDFQAFQRRYLSLKAVGAGDEQSLVVAPYDTAAGEQRAMTANQRAIVEALGLETCQSGASLRDLVEITGIPLSTLHRSVSALLRMGHVIRSGTGYKLAVPGVPSAVPGVEQSTGQAGEAQGRPEGAYSDKGGQGVPVFQVFHAPAAHKELPSVEQVEQVKQRNAYYEAGL
jgi:archaellum biogenesis ATPase FlaH